MDDEFKKFMLLRDHLKELVRKLDTAKRNLRPDYDKGMQPTAIRPSVFSVRLEGHHERKVTIGLN